MLQIWGDLWGYPADAVAVTTNGTVRQGLAVMGAGTAKQARDRHPLLPRALGRSINEAGNHVYYLGAFDGTDQVTRRIVSFPVKSHVWQSAEVELIRTSCAELTELLNEQGWERLVLPRPGCGMGGLSWDTVYPVIAALLDDRVHVIERPDPNRSDPTGLQQRLPNLLDRHRTVLERLADQ